MDRILIAGACNTGKELAERLSVRHQIVLLDNNSGSIDGYGQLLTLDQTPITISETRGLWAVYGDGTSRLVLQKLFDPELRCALVATAGQDEVNLEIGRVGREVGFDPIIAIQHNSEAAISEQYSNAHITALDRSLLLAGQVELSLLHQGAIIPSGIGLGRGELIEIRLVRTSPVIGRPLKNLAPHRWRVSAIFRNDEVVVPTGETTLEVDDRVLLVGDPKILQTVSEYLRKGTPHFPQPYGPNIVTLEFSGPDDNLFAEAEGLARASEALRLIRGLPGAQDSQPLEETDALSVPASQGEVDPGSFGLTAMDKPGFVTRTTSQRPGVVVTRSTPRSLAARFFGMRGRDAQLCDQIDSIVLFARGSFPYKRILLPVSESQLNIHSAEVAIDITRQLDASLTAINVDLPRLISGLSDEAIHFEVVPIRKLCELYEVPLDYQHREGNPIKQLKAETNNHDLVIVARRHKHRDTYFDPDVALRIAAKSTCSVLVLTIRDEE
ncbi:MAG: NAD-binding protein [Deltaproteobacteria bacterium]|nr:NAD-binding protein [Deltaproteobacteria bacterium]